METRVVPASEKAPVKTGALDPFLSLRRSIDQMFDDFVQGWPGRPVRSLLERETLWPLGYDGGAGLKVDVSENEKEIEICAELPGMDEKDVEVVLREGMLTIKGEKKAEREEKKKDYYMMERQFGNFQRSIRLPETIDQDKIKASFDKGVLSVVCPKLATAAVKEKKIKIGRL